MLGEKGINGAVENSTLVVANANATHFIKNQPQVNDRHQVRCDYYKKPHHTREICLKLHGKLVDWKSTKTGGKRNQGVPSTNDAKRMDQVLTKEQVDQILKIQKYNPQSGIPSGSFAQTKDNPSVLSSNSISTPLTLIQVPLII